MLRQRAGIRLGTDADVSGPLTARSAYRSTHGYLLADLDVAVTTTSEPDQVNALLSTTREPGSPIVFVERERIVRMHPVKPAPDTTRGGGEDDNADWRDPTRTWGIRAIGAHDIPLTGRGARIAILDSGIDDHHPDMADKPIVQQSFVADETPDDHVGHGTHVAGIAAGPRTGSKHPGYGVAPDAQLFVGKVINSAGIGTDGAVLSAIAWAVRHRCPIVCLSLGSAVMPGELYSTTFERVATRALRAGTLLIAAAGNGSNRAEDLAAPVTHPGDCPSVMAVGALAPGDLVADFSNASVNPAGGAVDLVAHGVDVFSAWLGGYREVSGTSMAAPHVAGVAALFHQATGGATGSELWRLLVSNARRLPLPSRDVGAGLVQVP